VFGVICTLANLIGYDAWIGPNPPVNCLAVFPPLIFAALRVKPLARLLSLRPLTFLGDISYSIYLVHVPLQMAILALSRAFGIKLLITKPGWLLTYALIVVGTATVTRYAIEIPASRWIRRRYRGEQAAAPTKSIVVPAA
jgi:peptidoglycan/LPS O-acetylase OafA/YrhL